MTEFDVLRVAAAGMEAQRAALDVAARNLAASEVHPGGTFDRLVPRYTVAFDDEASSEDSGTPIRFVGTTVQRGSDADAVTEMVAILNAQRAYEANAAVFDLGKRLAERAVELGRS